LRRSRQSLWTRFALRKCDEIGDRISLDGTPDIHNLGFISIGSGVGIKSSPTVSHLITSPAGSLRIQDEVRIGHGASISASSSITIEKGAQIGPFAIVIDTDFHEVGEHDSSGAAAPITIGCGAVLGARVTVLRGSSIGAGARVQAGSVVSGPVPAGARVSGVPAREHRDAPTREPTSLVVTLPHILRVVAETFALRYTPEPNRTPESIEGWDSLGTLNLLLSLEEAFEVNLSGEELYRLRTVGELLEVIEEAQHRASLITESQTVLAGADSGAGNL
jgi:acetyltransferase-like isoleucine patch superfamily enzyme/acyl carrier protein